MRFPNVSTLNALYECSDHHFAVVRTMRYEYRLYRDVMFPRHDVVQRTSLRDPSDVQQRSFERPSVYR